MRTGVFAGSFCPITNGHVDAIEKSARLVDKLYVVVGINSDKDYEITNQQRLSLVERAVQHIANVQVVLHTGMMTDFCEKVGADVMIKAVRNAVDAQQAIDINDVNERYWQGETVFVIGSSKYRHVSSTLVRELISLGKSISGLVPSELEQEIVEYFKK